MSGCSSLYVQCRRQKRRPSVGLFIYSGAGTQTCEGGCWWEGKACCLASLHSLPGKRCGGARIALSPSWAGVAAVHPHSTSHEEPSSLKAFTCQTKRKCTSLQGVVGLHHNRGKDLDGCTLYGMVKSFFFTPKAKELQKFTWYPTPSPDNLLLISS